MDDAKPPREHARTGEKLPWDPMRAAVVGLAVDAAAAEVVTALREAGVRSILLKGPSFDAWLYEPDEPRRYVDIDLLVPSSDGERVARALEGLGYRQRSEREPASVVEHAKVWVRAADDMEVDLHRTLSGAEAKGVDPWEVLSTETDTMQVGGTEVEILSEPGRAVHVALHAAVPGENEKKTITDLSRAVERLPMSTWQAATVLANRLGARTAFATGLRRHPRGAELAARLGLASERSVEAVMLANSVAHSSWTVNRLANAPGPASKLRILIPRLFPNPDFMRVWYPIARRGAAGLGLAYLQRFGWLLRESGPAVSAWWRASREARRNG